MNGSQPQQCQLELLAMLQNLLPIIHVFKNIKQDKIKSFTSQPKLYNTKSTAVK